MSTAKVSNGIFMSANMTENTTVDTPKMLVSSVLESGKVMKVEI